MTGVVLALLWGAAGCVSDGEPADRSAQADRVFAPPGSELGADLDIAVRQRGGVLVLDNREASGFAGQQLWLNRQWNADAPAIPPAERVELDLTVFVNGYGETYPVGGLLSPDKTERVVSAELYDPGSGVRRRLLVWPPSESW